MNAESPSGKGHDRVPAAGAAIVELLNSRQHAIFPDRLDVPEVAAAIARLFAPDATGLTPGQVDEVRAVRERLVSIVSAAADPTRARAAWRDFADHAAGVTLRQDFAVAGEVTLRQVGGDPVIGGITLAVADLVSSAAWPRVRICANEPCAAVFYDTTRSRTQRWHSYEMCGNRSNVAAYRARRSNPPAGAGN